MTTEIALENQTVFGPIEEGSPLFQLQHTRWRFLGVYLSHAPVVEELPAAHGVAEVDLPIVFGPDVAEGRGDTALGHHRVRFTKQRLANESGPHALRRGFDGRAKAGPTGAHDQHVALMGFESVVHQIKRTSVMTPMASRRT